MVGSQLKDVSKVESCLLEVAVRLQDLSQLQQGNLNMDLTLYR